MKDKIILFLGIILAVFVLAITFLSLENNKNDTKKSFDDEETFVCDESKFSIIKLSKDEDNKYIVEIKTVVTVNDNSGFASKKYYAMKYPVEVDGNVMTNTEKKFKIKYEVNYLEFTSDDKDKSNIYAGKYYSYKNEDKYYQLANIDSGEYSGQYINKEKEQATMNVILKPGSNEKEYIVSGSVSNDGDFYALLNEIIHQSGTEYLSEGSSPSISYTFKDNSLTIDMFKVENGKRISIDNVLNGKYDKLDKISYKDMIAELDNSVNLGNGYGEVY